MELRVEDLRKSYGGTAVLQGVSFTAEIGLTRVTGSSGIGKTTLLRILLGLESPDGGATNAGHFRWAAVFQEDRLLEQLDAAGNLRFALGAAYDETAARALLAELPSGRAPGEPVLFMGHGSRHAAESRYEALAAAVRERDPLVLMGTLNGTIRLEHIVEHLRASGRPFDRVWLLPLLAVVGRHTLEDMAGDSEHSWRSRLEAEGIACVPVLRGMMEYQGFMDIWVDNLAQAMKGWG